MLKIQVLHNKECTFWPLAREMLEHMIAEQKLDAKLEEVLVSNDGEAAAHRFAGSPQVTINGRDIDAMAERITNFHASGCRPYFFEGKAYDYPSREMIEEALRRLGALY